MTENIKRTDDELRIQVNVSQQDIWENLEGVGHIVAGGAEIALTGLKMLGGRGTAWEMSPSEVARAKELVGLAV